MTDEPFEPLASDVRCVWAFWATCPGSGIHPYYGVLLTFWGVQLFWCMCECSTFCIHFVLI